MQAENAIIRLHRYAVWSESSLFVHAKMYSFSCCCTNYRFEDSSLNECKNSWHNKGKNSSWLIFIQKPLPVTLTMTSCLWFDLKKSKDLKLDLFDSEIILHFIWITPLMKIFFTRKCAVFTDTTLAAFVRPHNRFLWGYFLVWVSMVSTHTLAYLLPPPPPDSPSPHSPVCCKNWKLEGKWNDMVPPPPPPPLSFCKKWKLAGKNMPPHPKFVAKSGNKQEKNWF